MVMFLIYILFYIQFIKNWKFIKLKIKKVYICVYVCVRGMCVCVTPLWKPS